MTNTIKKPMPTARVPTARELVAARQRRQKKELPLEQAGKKPAGKELKVVGAKKPAVARPTNEEYVRRYLDELAPVGTAGRIIRFSKEGEFKTVDDGKEVDQDTMFAVLADQTWHGYMRFNGKGVQPTRMMGPLYGGFELPPVETLPDRDESTWEVSSYTGRLEDPWKVHFYVVLQAVDTMELFVFDTSSPTGRSAVAQLLQHYERMRDSGDVPVVCLRPGGFMSRKKRVAG
jgi:hypothetical protein